MERIAVLGAGAWGLTLAELLCGKGHAVTVWDVDEARIASLARSRTPGKPPGLALPDSLGLTASLGEAIDKAAVCVCVVPSFAVRAICERMRDAGHEPARRAFINCAKGIEQGTLLLPSMIYAEFFGDDALDHYAVLSGPSHAEEVCRRLPTTVVSASRSEAAASQARDLFILPEFRVYTQDDVAGVELGAALKNVVAIAAGACDGLGFGDNTKAALITRGLAEIARAGEAMGARAATLAGLAGLGDLVVTATSRHSRNRMFGELLASGRTVEDALTEVGAVVEGYGTSKSAAQLARKLDIPMPICETVNAVCHNALPMDAAMRTLLAREPRPEIY